jgi:hypothetical protein
MAVAAAEARMAVGVTLVMLATSWVTMTAMNATTMMETGGSRRFRRDPKEPEGTRRNPKKPEETRRFQKIGVILGSSRGHN